MDEVVLLKLGGSVVTHKGGDCRIDEESLAAISRAIAAHMHPGLLIIHGAGSCGHPEAKRFGIVERGLDPENTAGVYQTHRSVARLNAGVVACLRSAGIEAVGIHALSGSVARNGRLDSFAVEPIRIMLARGIVPVLHGDVVMDIERGATIVSGDQLLAYVARALGATRVGVATDVAGVLDGGRVIPKIGPATAKSLPIGNSSHIDVTGGMRGKVQELLRLAEDGVDSHIFHAARIGDFLSGTDHGGTVVSIRS
ncbi:MAG: isopentenyl phosphate kinase [Methanomicrobiales archaeon]|nr:isopentenyl phosphate kinase [Methanomicrobiales archaeon]MDI6875405.1 isopentenyl phosphate kinase [Methanomicrobiales archaeon]